MFPVYWLFPSHIQTCCYFSQLKKQKKISQIHVSYQLLSNFPAFFSKTLRRLQPRLHLPDYSLSTPSKGPFALIPPLWSSLPKVTAGSSLPSVTFHRLDGVDGSPPPDLLSPLSSPATLSPVSLLSPWLLIFRLFVDTFYPQSLNLSTIYVVPLVSSARLVAFFLSAYIPVLQ